MRFVIFYTDHPKIKGYIARVWHNFQTHSNFQGEMTHNLFIKHYKIGKENVSSLGDVYYNIETKQWEIEPNKPLVVIKQERRNQDCSLILNLMNEKYKEDTQMIGYSLKEQEFVKKMQHLKNLRINFNTRS